MVGNDERTAPGVVGPNKTLIRCAAKACDFNDNGICQRDEVVITWNKRTGLNLTCHQVTDATGRVRGYVG